MKSPLLSTAALVMPAVAGLVLAAPQGAVRLTYAPQEGSRWHKTFEVTTELEWDSLAVAMGGQEVDPQFLPQIELDLTDTTRLEVTDEVRGAGQGRPRLIHRTYESAARTAEQTMEMAGMMPEPARSEGQGASPLEGRTVAFRWAGDGEDAAATWVESGSSGASDDDLLAGLAADLDLLGWLPDEDLAEGQHWKLPAQLLAGLLEPGGDLSIELEGEGAEEFDQYSRGEVEFDGELTLRLAGLREEGGDRLAVIEIAGDFETVHRYAGDLDDVPVADGTTTVTDRVDYELEGELVWDLSVGVLRSFEASADMILESNAVKDPGQEGPDFESTATLSGTQTFAVTVERAD